MQLPSTATPISVVGWRPDVEAGSHLEVGQGNRASDCRESVMVFDKGEGSHIRDADVAEGRCGNVWDAAGPCGEG